MSSSVPHSAVQASAASASVEADHSIRTGNNPERDNIGDPSIITIQAEHVASENTCEHPSVTAEHAPVAQATIASLEPDTRTGGSLTYATVVAPDEERPQFTSFEVSGGRSDILVEVLPGAPRKRRNLKLWLCGGAVVIIAVVCVFTTSVLQEDDEPEIELDEFPFLDTLQGISKSASQSEIWPIDSFRGCLVACQGFVSLAFYSATRNCLCYEQLYSCDVRESDSTEFAMTAATVPVSCPKGDE